MTRLLSLLVLLALLPGALAQLATGTDPGLVADEALRAWLAQPPVDLGGLSARTTQELCEVLPDLLLAPPPPEGTTVNYAARREQDAVGATDPERRVYSYPASLPNGALEVVDVTLERRGSAWDAVRVGFHRDAGPTGIRAWLQQPIASWLFIAFTLAVLGLLIRPSFFRRWLAAGWATIRRFRRTVIATQVVFYGLFFGGALIGSQLPDTCTASILAVLDSAITTLGATDAYGSGNIPRAAVVTFYQNFGMVSVVVLFSLAVLLGFPAYLFGGLSFLAQGIPFGLLGGLAPGQLLAVGVLLVLELTAYFLVIAGGGILLVTLFREGFSAFGTGVRRAAQMLPFAMLLLLVGAWYEALIIILPSVLGGP